ncbi:MAG TPA: GldG family protein [Clostridiales bacterium]|nr:GldG family protein [Clostridiales bacterium]
MKDNKINDIQPRKKIKNKAALKHGALATVFTALFIVAVIVINILATALAERFPLDIDLSAQKINTISEENRQYLKKLTREVSIIVCAPEEAFTNGMMNYMARAYYNTVDPTESNTDPYGKYFPQTLKLLTDYPKYNEKINLSFADPQEPSFANIISKYSNVEINYGDILVESNFVRDGQNVHRYKVLNFEDLFEKRDPTGMYAAMGYTNYEISGSKVETAVTSAIYTVTSDKTTKAGIITAHTAQDYTDTLKSNMENNNYEFVEINDLISNDIPSDLDLIILAAPNSDLSVQELDRIEKFLSNNGERGKAMMFFASPASPQLPNLYDFLEEWGIIISEGTVYETNPNNYLGVPTTIGLNNSKTDFTKAANNLTGVVYVSSGTVPMSVGFESQGNRTTTRLMTTSNSVVVQPKDAGEDWEPGENAQTSQYDAAILSKDTINKPDFSQVSSYLVAFASTDLINSNWTQYSMVANLEIVLATANSITGRADSDITFVTKSITNESFADRVTKTNVIVMTVVLLAVVPVTIIVIAVVVWIRRKNR